MRCVFLGTGGFLGRIDGETRCAFRVDEPVDHGFDPARLIRVDLARTPTAAAANQIGWDDVQVEDCYTGPNGTIGGTTLGPRWPEPQLGGAIYLERDFARALPSALRPPCPPIGMSAHPYECMTTVYWPQADDPRAARTTGDPARRHLVGRSWGGAGEQARQAPPGPGHPVGPVQRGHHLQHGPGGHAR